MKKIRITTKDNEVITGDLDVVNYFPEESREGVWVFIKNCDHGFPQQGFNVRNAVKMIETIDVEPPQNDIEQAANLLPHHMKADFLKTVMFRDTACAAIADAFCYVIEEWKYRTESERRRRIELEEQLKGNSEQHLHKFSYMGTIGDDVEQWERDGEMVVRMNNAKWYHTVPSPNSFSRKDEQYAEYVRETMAQMKRNDT